MEDFIPFDLAKKLNEKGFREKCLMHYTKIGGLYLNSIDTYDRPNQELDYTDFQACLNLGNNVGLIDAPTISQVLKWLREENAIHLNVVLWEKGWYCDVWCFEYYEEEKEYSYKREYQTNDYNNYEQAALAGVNYCLDNLI